VSYPFQHFSDKNWRGLGLLYNYYRFSLVLLLNLSELLLYTGPSIFLYMFLLQNYSFSSSLQVLYHVSHAYAIMDHKYIQYSLSFVRKSIFSLWNNICLLRYNSSFFFSFIYLKSPTCLKVNPSIWRLFFTVVFFLWNSRTVDTSILEKS
jgi:hypothetical protein